MNTSPATRTSHGERAGSVAARHELSIKSTPLIAPTGVSYLFSPHQRQGCFDRAARDAKSGTTYGDKRAAINRTRDHDGECCTSSRRTIISSRSRPRRARSAGTRALANMKRGSTSRTTAWVIIGAQRETGDHRSARRARYSRFSSRTTPESGKWLAVQHDRRGRAAGAPKPGRMNNRWRGGRGNCVAAGTSHAAESLLLRTGTRSRAHRAEPQGDNLFTSRSVALNPDTGRWRGTTR